MPSEWPLITTERGVAISPYRRQRLLKQPLSQDKSGCVISLAGRVPDGRSVGSIATVLGMKPNQKVNIPRYRASNQLCHRSSDYNTCGMSDMHTSLYLKDSSSDLGPCQLLSAVFQAA